jgi:hypothetical protein
MYLQSHIYKNIPVSFDFMNPWNQGLFLCSPCINLLVFVMKRECFLCAETRIFKYVKRILRHHRLMSRCTPVAKNGWLDMSIITANHNPRCNSGEYRLGQHKHWKSKPVSRSVYGTTGKFFYIILCKNRPCDEAVFQSKGSKKYFGLQNRLKGIQWKMC